MSFTQMRILSDNVKPEYYTLMGGTLLGSGSKKRTAETTINELLVVSDVVGE